MQPQTPVRLYSVLGLPEGASIDAVKKSFRDLALKCHPDKNPNDPNAPDVFKQLNTAYQILGDPKKKAIYDSEIKVAAYTKKYCSPGATGPGAGGGARPHTPRGGNPTSANHNTSNYSTPSKSNPPGYTAATSTTTTPGKRGLQDQNQPPSSTTSTNGGAVNRSSSKAPPPPGGTTPSQTPRPNTAEYERMLADLEKQQQEKMKAEAVARRERERLLQERLAERLKKLKNDCEREERDARETYLLVERRERDGIQLQFRKSVTRTAFITLRNKLDTAEAYGRLAMWKGSELFTQRLWFEFVITRTLHEEINAFKTVWNGITQMWLEERVLMLERDYTIIREDIIAEHHRAYSDLHTVVKLGIKESLLLDQFFLKSIVPVRTTVTQEEGRVRQRIEFLFLESTSRYLNVAIPQYVSREVLQELYVASTEELISSLVIDDDEVGAWEALTTAVLTQSSAVLEENTAHLREFVDTFLAAVPRFPNGEIWKGDSETRTLEILERYEKLTMKVNKLDRENDDCIQTMTSSPEGWRHILNTDLTRLLECRSHQQTQTPSLKELLTKEGVRLDDTNDRLEKENLRLEAQLHLISHRDEKL